MGCSFLAKSNPLAKPILTDNHPIHIHSIQFKIADPDRHLSAMFQCFVKFCQKSLGMIIDLERQSNGF